MVDGGVGRDLDPAHLHVVLVAGLDLDGSVPQERKLTGVPDIHLESVPVRVDGGRAGDVGVAVQYHFQTHLEADLPLPNILIPG